MRAPYMMTAIVGTLLMAAFSAAPDEKEDASTGFACLSTAVGWVTERTLDDGPIDIATNTGSIGGSDGRVIALVARNVSMRTPEPQAVVFATGEVLPGVLHLGARVGWRTKALGMIPLEEGTVAALIFRQGTGWESSETNDVVILANGDSIVGLVDGLADPLAIQREDESVILIPIERVGSISFVHKPQDPGATRMWLKDGSIIDADGVSKEGDIFRASGIRLSPTEPSRTIRAIDLAGIRFGGAKLTPLGEVQPTVEQASDASVPRLLLSKPTVSPLPAPLDAPAVRFVGPALFRYPPIARQVVLAARASLAERTREYGDVELVIRQGTEERFRTRLNAANPRADIRALLTSGEWSIELGEGSNGPIGDIVVLEQALFIHH